VEVFKKVGRKYVSMGWEFTGFPSNGIWLVKDGSQNCMVRLDDISTTPNFYIDFAKFENEHSEYLMNKATEAKQYSFVDLTRWSSEFWAIKKEEEMKKDKAKEEMDNRRW
jgi:hypothetical protein